MTISTSVLSDTSDMLYLLTASITKPSSVREVTLGKWHIIEKKIHKNNFLLNLTPRKLYEHIKFCCMVEIHHNLN
jgi:hypothetical protein